MDGRDCRIIRKEALQQALLEANDTQELISIRNEINHINLELQGIYHDLKDDSVVMGNLCNYILRSEVLETPELQKLSLFVDISLSEEDLPLPIYGLMMDISMMLHEELRFRYLDAMDNDLGNNKEDDDNE